MKNVLLLISIFALLYSCKDENETDSRDKYVGEYSFLVITKYWQLDNNNTSGTLTTTDRYDTTIYEGEIRKYANAHDTLCNLCYFGEYKNENPDEILTIQFGDCALTTTQLAENGGFVQKSNSYISQNGSFTGVDTLLFNIDIHIFLGVGSNITVKGIRNK